MSPGNARASDTGDTQFFCAERNGIIAISAGFERLYIADEDDNGAGIGRR